MVAKNINAEPMSRTTIEMEIRRSMNWSTGVYLPGGTTATGLGDRGTVTDGSSNSHDPGVRTLPGRRGHGGGRGVTALDAPQGGRAAALPPRGGEVP
jgi:hypothetical protein